MGCHVIRLGCALALLVASAATAAELGLDLDEIDLRQPDPRTEARLAGWSSPLGRLAHHMASEQALVARGGLVGTPRAAVIGLKLQRGLGLQMTGGTSEAGLERYEQTVAVIRWPWSTGDQPPVLPLDEQLALLLGRRLER